MTTIASQQLTPPESELDLDRVRADPAWVHKISLSQAKRLRAVAICRIDDRVAVATCNPDHQAVEEFFRQRLQLPCDLIKVGQNAFRKWLVRWFQPQLQPAIRGAAATGADVSAQPSDAILSAALLRGASDIHVLPRQDAASIQFRVDGLLEDFQSISLAEHASLANRIKVLSGMDIAEKRQPQDGRYSIHDASHGKVEIRVATIPSRFGEKVTMRILHQSSTPTRLSDLGMLDQERLPLERAMHRPNGLILITGPTGSGKSTTLYAAMTQWMQNVGGNLITVEDPIEYEIPGATQVEVDSGEKVSFSRVLRSILRHDPDTIMLGEIRDEETAQLAIKAALTGHLVFSTLHTNTAAGAIPRLLDLGVDPYLVADTLRIVLAQRLVRRLCPACCTQVDVPCSAEWIPELAQLASQPTYTAAGCVYCAGRGYSGRTALYESLVIEDSLRSLIASRPSEAEILAAARTKGFRSLLDCGSELVVNAATSLDQVIQAAGG